MCLWITMAGRALERPQQSHNRWPPAPPKRVAYRTTCLGGPQHHPLEVTTEVDTEAPAVTY